VRDDDKTRRITGRRGTMPPPSECRAGGVSHGLMLSVCTRA
jgi:hypothetical protein